MVQDLGHTLRPKSQKAMATTPSTPNTSVPIPQNSGVFLLIGKDDPKITLSYLMTEFYRFSGARDVLAGVVPSPTFGRWTYYIKIVSPWVDEDLVKNYA